MNSISAIRVFRAVSLRPRLDFSEIESDKIVARQIRAENMNVVPSTFITPFGEATCF